jgi:hypothetical protein
VSQPERTQRPWTVYVLTVPALIGMAWSLAFGHLTLWDLLLIPLNLWITYSIWMGKQWAFTLSFTFAALCAVAFLAALVIPLVLLGTLPPSPVWWGLLTSSVWVVLLLHPKTKRFAGLEVPAQPKQEAPAG